MVEFKPDLWISIAIFFVFLCFILTFSIVYKIKKIKQLELVINKNINDFNQLIAKYENLQQIKNQLDQTIVRFQTATESLQARLAERDEKIQYLQNELNESQQRHENITNQMSSLKEHFGIAKAKSDSLQKQLEESRGEFFRKDQECVGLTKKATELLRELTQLKTTLVEKEKHFIAQQQDFVSTKQQLTTEFQNIANQILTEKSRTFSESNQIELNNLLKPFREQIDSFQKRVNEIHSESLKGNAGLEAEIKKVLQIGLNMSQEANNLTSALKGNKKILGCWGEVQLEQTLQLAGLVEKDHYQSQSYLKNQQGKINYPDFVLYLPDKKHLVIDSKMSLLAYERAVNADNEKLRQQSLLEHVKAIKNHIDSLSTKNYSDLIGLRSPNFVLMFVAVEAAYIEAMKMDRELFNYGYEKNVILVSHTTLMPILRTVANLWRIERGNTEAREISERAGDIYNQICTFSERLLKLGNSLATANSNYNNVVTAFVGQQGLVGKVERFKDLSAKSNKQLHDVNLLHSDLNTEKLFILNKK
ncbi:DNA recombination protein RmuC [Seminibacterium arietis]|uniref:DNA recombination protein RmuC n=1 Tax=Seminibacterium arietis TaxID=1173502 RepID=A0ABW3I9U1_9PAST